MEQQRPARTLHEAIRLVLEDRKDRTAATADICNEIIRRKLYAQRDGGPPFPDQVFLRARKYRRWFDLIDGETVRLRLDPVRHE